MFIELRSVKEDGYPPASVVAQTPWRICFIYNNRVYSGYPDVGGWHTSVYVGNERVFELTVDPSDVKYWFLLPAGAPRELEKTSKSVPRATILDDEMVDSQKVHDDIKAIRHILEDAFVNDKEDGDGDLRDAPDRGERAFLHWIKTIKRDWQESGDGG